MRRTQIQLEGELYAAVRRRAFEEGRSMSAVIRDAVAVALKPSGHRRRIEDYRFVGAGRSRQSAGHPVSAHHDEALSEAISHQRGRRR